VITLLGLGPGDPNLLTREAWDVLSASKTIYLRTLQHPTVAGLPSHLDLKDFDALYNGAVSFDGVYARIVRAVIAVAKKGDVVYAVPGHPLVGEATTPLILQRARELNIPTRIIAGLSFIEQTLEAMTMDDGRWTTHHPSSVARRSLFDPLSGLQICDALDLATMHHPPLNPDKPALVAQVYSRAVASDVKLTLMNQYPSAHPVWIVQGQGIDKETRRQGDKEKRSTLFSVPLPQLDHADIFNHLTSLYVPPLDQVGGFEAFQETIAYLRAPEGCPWIASKRMPACAPRYSKKPTKC